MSDILDRRIAELCDIRDRVAAICETSTANPLQIEYILCELQLVGALRKTISSEVWHEWQQSIPKDQMEVRVCPECGHSCYPGLYEIPRSGGQCDECDMRDAEGRLSARYGF